MDLSFRTKPDRLQHSGLMSKIVHLQLPHKEDSRHSGSILPVINISPTKGIYIRIALIKGSGVPGINSIDDQMTVATPAAVEEAPEPTAAESEEPAAAGDRSYTVQSGDTLWKIAQEMYGDGSKYMKIFDANSELLEHPDRIFPGQELTIPNKEG